MRNQRKRLLGAEAHFDGGFLHGDGLQLRTFHRYGAGRFSVAVFCNHCDGCRTGFDRTDLALGGHTHDLGVGGFPGHGLVRGIARFCGRLQHIGLSDRQRERRLVELDFLNRRFNNSDFAGRLFACILRGNRNRAFAGIDSLDYTVAADSRNLLVARFPVERGNRNVGGPDICRQG